MPATEPREDESAPRPFRLGVLGFGEGEGAFGAGLADAGLTGIRASAPGAFGTQPSPLVHDRAEAARVQLVRTHEELLRSPAAGEAAGRRAACHDRDRVLGHRDTQEGWNPDVIVDTHRHFSEPAIDERPYDPSATHLGSDPVLAERLFGLAR